MSTFYVVFNTDNAAFVEDDLGHLEIARILRVIAERIKNDSAVEGKAFDYNGNAVGDFRWEKK